jgi:hypothetical protein
MGIVITSDTMQCGASAPAWAIGDRRVTEIKMKKFSIPKRLLTVKPFRKDGMTQPLPKMVTSWDW